MNEAQKQACVEEKRKGKNIFSDSQWCLCFGYGAENKICSIKETQAFCFILFSKIRLGHFQNQKKKSPFLIQERKKSENKIVKGHVVNTEATREGMRLQGASLIVDGGKGYDEVGMLLGVSQRTLMRWVKQYRAGERSFSDKPWEGTKEITSRSRIRWLSSVGTMYF